MDDILVVDEELVDINHGSNGSSNGKKGRHSAAKGEKKSKKKRRLSGALYEIWHLLGMLGIF